jgi:hypothetical protein
MTLAEMEARLALIVRDISLQSEFANMLNDAILELAADFDLPALKLITPYPLSVTNDEWIYTLPESYHKRLFRCRDSEYNKVTIRHRSTDLDDLDEDHDETADHVTHVAVMDTGSTKYLCTYPMATESLKLWFYEKPGILEEADDEPQCMPAEFQERVIIPKVIIKNYQLLQDQVENFDLKPLQYWESKLQEGLYGAPGRSIGLINWHVKLQGGPRRHGGRDPVGWRV